HSLLGPSFIVRPGKACSRCPVERREAEARRRDPLSERLERCRRGFDVGEANALLEGAIARTEARYNPGASLELHRRCRCEVWGRSRAHRRRRSFGGTCASIPAAERALPDERNLLERLRLRHHDRTRAPYPEAIAQDSRGARDLSDLERDVT